MGIRAAFERTHLPIGPTAVGVIGFAVYLRTLMPGVSFGDWAEMQTVPHVLGVAHPTGYPTYILAAWLFELLPVGSIAFRANLFSAVLVAGTLATAALIAQRLGVRPLIAVAAALALGAVGTVWAAATVAEVNPLHLFLMAFLVHRALAWSIDRRPRDLILCGLLLGLALGNHLLTLFVAPFLFAFAVWSGRRELWKRPVLFLAAAAATVAALAVYLYIPIAASLAPPLPYNHPTTLDGVLWLVTGTQFRGQFDFLSPKGPGEFTAALPALWNLFLARSTPVLPVLGVVGLAILVRVRPAFGLACLAILGFGVYVWADYQQLEHYLLVPFLMLAVGLAATLEWGARTVTWLAGRVAGRLGTASVRAGRIAARRLDAGPVVGLVGLAFAIALASANWATADRSGDRSGQAYVDSLFGALPPDAAVLSYWDPSAPLWYGHFIEGLRPDVLIVDDTNIVYEGWGTVEARVASLICERPVFVIRVGPPDVAPLRTRWLVEPFMDVRVSALGPSAAITQQVYRVQPRNAATCATGIRDGGGRAAPEILAGPSRGARTDPE